MTKIIDWIKEHKILISIVFIGTIFRFYKLDNQSLWIDEIFTMNVSDTRNSFSFIYNFLKSHDPHPPLYYFLVHTFFLFFGYSTLVLKIFSATVGVLGIFSIYYLGKELVNKEVGTILAALTSMNYFHIYYSQEGRMYSLFFLTTSIALYTLSKFLKNQNIKTTTFFVFGSLLMIYTHFLGVFILIGFYIILLTNFLKSKYNLKLLKHSFLASVAVIILYIPSIIIVFSNPNRDEIWIKPPTLKTFEFMFKEFFGYSSMTVTILICLLFFSFILFLIKKKNKTSQETNCNHAVQIVFISLLTTISLTLIYSFVRLPIVVNRYFIGILPLILILIAISIYNLKNKYFKILVILFLAILSFNNLISNKKFYNSFYKTQFKHATDYIVTKYPNDLIVSKLGNFYLGFYLNQKNLQNNIVESDINAYVSNIKEHKNNLKDFWYFEGHLPNYSVTNETKNFLDNNYEMDEHLEFFDAYVKHFKVKKIISK